jgi:2-polyprenyl-3-methyl-5-hydroxy-6-metoxy-1,4-benzoquinol methylase
VKFNNNFLYNYLKNAPFTLAIERSMECEILSRQEFKEPVLDIGCGDGLFAHTLFNQKIDTGIDPDSKEITRAKRYGIYREIINCSGSEVPKGNESYQIIFSNSVLEHIPEIKAVLKEVHRLLMPGGNFYATVPTNYFDKYTFGSQILIFLQLKSLAAKYRQLFNRFWKHYHYHEIEKWKELFEASGFKVIENIEYCPRKICMLESVFIPVSIFNFLCKKLFDRWVVLNAVRMIIIYPVYLLVKSCMQGTFPVQNGGIVFFHLTK